jgi:hypothetical protein
MDPMVKELTAAHGSNLVVINSWYFEKRKNPSIICTRYSPALDYIAEWILVGGKYTLKYLTCTVFNTHLQNVLEHGTILLELDTIHDVLIYCSTHYHPKHQYTSLSTFPCIQQGL